MNVDASTKPEPITQVGAPDQFITAREMRGWSMSDVAAKLGMTSRQIEAIEQGRWDALPGHAFVRGAIRAYGKALQVDVAPLLATLGAGLNTPELRTSASLDSPLPRHGTLGFDNGGSGRRIVWILLGVIGVVAIAMYFGRGADLRQAFESGGDPQQSDRVVHVVPIPAVSSAQDSAPGSDPAPAPDAARSDTAAPDGAAASGASSAGAAGLASAAVSGTGASASIDAPSSDAVSGSAAPASQDSGEPTGAPAADTATQSAAAEAAKGATHEAESLVMRFERESWVDVRDATGRVLLLGTQPANSTRALSGEKPYSMTIGNAPFVRVEHDGRAIDLGAVTQKGVARLRIE